MQSPRGAEAAGHPCAAVIVTSIKPNSELHGVGIDVTGRAVATVGGEAVAGLSFGDTVAKVQRGGRPLTIGFGPPPFQLEEDAVERLREADEQQQEQDGVVAAGGEGPAAGEESLPHHWEANKAQGTYVALPSVGMRGLGMLGMAIRAAADEQGRRW